MRRRNAPSIVARCGVAASSTVVRRQSAEPPADNTPPVVDAALVFTAATGSPLEFCQSNPKMLHWSIEEQPNLPECQHIDEHPNWRRRLAPEARVLLDEPLAASRIATLAQRRPRL